MMASKSLGTLTLDLVARIGGFVAGLDKAGRESEKRSKQISKNMTAVGVAFGAAAAGSAAWATSQVKASIDAADALSKQSAQVAIAVEDLSSLNYAADLSGVSIDQLTGGLNKFNRTVDDAFAGEGKGKGAFDSLGISIEGVDGKLKDNMQLIEELADAFSKMEDGAAKSAIAQDLFGKSGAKLLPLLNSGASGLQAMADEAERLGIIIDSDTAAAAEQFNDNLTRLQKSADALGISVAQDLLPEMTRITQAMVEAQKESGIFEAAWVGLGGVLAEGLGLNDSIDEQIKSIEKLLSGGVLDRLRLFGKDGLIEYYSEEELRSELERLKAQVAAQTEDVAPAVSVTATADSEEFQKREAALRKEIALYDETGEAAKLRYEIEKGMVDGLKDGEGDRLIALQRQLDAMKESSEAAKEQQQAYEQLQSTYDSQVETYQRQIALTGEVSEAERIRYETTLGSLAELDAAQKRRLEQLAAEADASQKLAEINSAYDSQVENYEREIALMGDLTELERLRYETSRGALQGLDAAQQQRLEGLAAEMDALKERQQLEQDVGSLVESLQTGEEKALADYTESMDQLNQAVAEGIPILGGYDQASQRVWERYQKDLQDAKDATDELSVYTDQAARNMQSSFADFLFDPFEDGLDGLLDNFGNILRRMAAEASAAQIFNSLGSWGDANSDAGGWTGMLAGFAGMFDAGGKIGAGQWGLVGERGPEIVRGPALITSRQETAKALGGNSLSIGTMVFPNVTNERQAREAGGAAARQLSRVAQSGQRYF